MFYIDHISDNPSHLLCNWDIVGEMSRWLIIIIYHLHTINKSPIRNWPKQFSMKTTLCCRWLRADNLFAFCKAKGCWGFGSELGGGSCSGRGNQAGGDSLTVCCSLQSSTALEPFHEKPNQRTAWSMPGKTRGGLLPAYEVKLKFGNTETRKRKV